MRARVQGFGIKATAWALVAVVFCAWSASAVADDRFVVEPELLLMRFQQANTAFAVESTPTGSQVSGRVIRLEPGTETGFRFGFGYRFMENWDVMLRYTTLESEVTNRASGPDNIIPLLTHPGDLSVALSAEAVLDQTYDVIGIEIGRRFGEVGAHRARVFVGPSAMTFEQQVFAVYDNFGDPWTVDARNDVSAFGFRMGAEGFLSFGKSGTGLFGRTAVGAYVASFDLSLQEVDLASPSEIIVDVVDELEGSSSYVEVAMGFSWERQFERWAFGLQLGYEIAHYSGFIDTGDFVDDVNPGKSITRDGSLGLDGGFFRLTFGF